MGSKWEWYMALILGSNSGEKWWKKIEKREKLIDIDSAQYS